MKKALCIISIPLMMLSGGFALFFAFMIFKFSVRDPQSLLFCLTCGVGGSMLILVGGWLYSFKRAAWRAALAVHGAILLSLVGYNVLLYLIAVSVTSASHPKPPFYFLRTLAGYLLHSSGIIGMAKGLLLLYRGSFAVLLASRRLFKD